MLALGDSLTVGYSFSRSEGFVAELQTAIRARGIRTSMLDAGVSGDTTAGGRARSNRALADPPNATIVALGSTDFLRAIPLEVTYASFDDILRRLAERNISALRAGMLALRNLGAEYVKAFERVYRWLAREHDVMFMLFFLERVAGNSIATSQTGSIRRRAAWG